MGRLNDVIFEYTKKNPVRFHMPGHKGKIDPRDVTELFFTDNLYNPDCELNLIDELEERISKVFFNNQSDRGDIYSLISCSGATLCVQGAVLALLKAKNNNYNNNYIICDTTAHISFINAISLLNIKPLWISLDDDLDDFEEKINYFAQDKNIKDIIGVFITSPDYFGVMKNIRSVSKICKKNSLDLVVDNSHGSHLAFYQSGQLHPINSGADISIDSVHKTLPALTGAAVIHSNKKFNEENLLRESMKMFASTSPSYLILQSIENLIDFLEEHGVEAHEILINNINLFKRDAEVLGFIFETNELCDPYRIILNCEDSGEVLYYCLAKKNIICEFFDKDSVIIIPGVSNNHDDFKKLFEALKDFSKTNKIKSKKLSELKKHNFYPPGFR